MRDAPTPRCIGRWVYDSTDARCEFRCGVDPGVPDDDQEPLVGGSCGTVSPGYRGECCARKNEGKPQIMCAGHWTYLPGTGCKYVCDWVMSFQDCVRAGNPVMESHPRQCRHTDGSVYTERI